MRKIVKIGGLELGSGKVYVQSMTNTKTSDIDATVKQILELEKAGCEIVRVSVPDEKSGLAIKEIVKNINIPLVADIHFSYKLAILAAENGAAKIRLNPGNIGSHDRVKYVADFLNERQIPIRIGVNGGSLDSKYENMPLDDAMVLSAMEHVHLLEDCNFDNIVISCKSSNVFKMISAYKKLSNECNYPLHIGVTEAGTYTQGLIKNAIGIGALLLDNIGDTIRVSLTDDPVKEVYAGIDILKACDMYDKPYCEVISCPTCARTEINVKDLALKVQELTKNVSKNLKIAVMGCIVNGIGESKDADFGVAGGKDQSIIFVDKKQYKIVKNDKILDELQLLIDKYDKR